MYDCEYEFNFFRSVCYYIYIWIFVQQIKTTNDQKKSYCGRFRGDNFFLGCVKFLTLLMTF